MNRLILFAGAIASLLAQVAAAATLHVGPGKPLARIEAAYAQARPGDVILVHPRKDGQPYPRVALQVRKPRLTFRAADPGGGRVKLSGSGYDYSGRGRVPRAMFQFEPGADGCVLEGFELTGASNRSSNGAGVRINQANHITIRNCEIHHNDMGIMSGGNGSLKTAVNQVIEHCVIHHNGNQRHAGFNHNLYLGGTSLTLRFCEVHSPLTGHNVKSRAHYNRIEYCYIHHSANREFDLVNARETAHPNSHAVLRGNVIVKDPRCRGNKTVIHFGAEGRGTHDGTIYLVHNTIVTPFIGPVIELSSGKANAHLDGNLIHGTQRRQHQVVLSARNGASADGSTVKDNWVAETFAGSLRRIGAAGAAANQIAKPPQGLFAGPGKHDYRLTQPLPRGGALAVKIPPIPGIKSPRAPRPLAWQYKHPAAKLPRDTDDKPDYGAYEHRVSR